MVDAVFVAGEVVLRAGVDVGAVPACVLFGVGGSFDGFAAADDGSFTLHSDLRFDVAFARLLGGELRKARTEFDALAAASARVKGFADELTIQCRKFAADCRIELGKALERFIDDDPAPAGGEPS